MNTKTIKAAKNLYRALEDFLISASGSSPAQLRNVPRRFKSPEELPSSVPEAEPAEAEPAEADSQPEAEPSSNGGRGRGRRKS